MLVTVEVFEEKKRKVLVFIIGGQTHMAVGSCNHA
jgi:hypothetical protein